MSYINPIPYIDEAKEFEMRIHVKLNEATDTRRAKEIVAEHILGLSKEELITWISCVKQYAVYPDSALKVNNND